MSRDMAKNYDQKRWEFAVNAHARCVEALERFSGRPGISYWQKKKIELEAQYPQLKAPK